MECDILIKLYDTVQRSLASQRNQRTADRKENHGDIEMQNQRSSSRGWVCQTESCSRNNQVVLQLVVHETKGEHHSMDSCEHEDEAIDGQPRYCCYLQCYVQSSIPFVHHPSIEPFLLGQFSLVLGTHLPRHQHSSQWGPSRSFRGLLRHVTHPVGHFLEAEGDVKSTAQVPAWLLYISFLCSFQRFRSYRRTMKEWQVDSEPAELTL